VANDTDDKGQGTRTLEDIATSIGTLLGKAERRWRESGASEAIEKAVTDLRDRASALVDEINAARTSSAAPNAPTAEPPPTPRTTRRVARKAAKQAVKRAVKKAVRTSRPARKARAKVKR
jgi:hypothetical protein